jgi:phospholipase/carboxylesterase
VLRREYPGPGLACFELSADDAPRPLVVCLHGFGANGADLEGLAGAIDPHGYAYVFPDAPLEILPGGDVAFLAWHVRGGRESIEEAAEAVAVLETFLDGVRARHPGQPMALVGFSQGAAVALRYALPRPDRVAGVAVLSGSLRRTDDLTATLPDRRDLPLFVAHGRADELVPLAVAGALLTYLQGHQYRPEFHAHDGGHGIPPLVVRELRSWLRRVMPPERTAQDER